MPLSEVVQVKLKLLSLGQPLAHGWWLDSRSWTRGSEIYQRLWWRDA